MVFISYAWGDEGRALASLIVEHLRSNGIPVTWDDDLDKLNPSSMQEWIETQAQQDIVVCVITQDYVERFGQGDSTSKRKGVLYESRIIDQRLFEHTASNNCPILPVMSVKFDIDLVPSSLRRLQLTRISRENPACLNSLLNRIRALSGLTFDGSSSANMLMSLAHTTRAASTLRLILRNLELASVGTSAAKSAIVDWITFADHVEPDLHISRASAISS
jgi:hypothetical protein